MVWNEKYVNAIFFFRKQFRYCAKYGNIEIAGKSAMKTNEKVIGFQKMYEGG